MSVPQTGPGTPQRLGILLIQLHLGKGSFNCEQVCSCVRKLTSFKASKPYLFTILYRAKVAYCSLCVGGKEKPQKQTGRGEKGAKEQEKIEEEDRAFDCTGLGEMLVRIVQFQDKS